MKKTAIIVCLALLVPAAARAADPLLLFSIAGNYLRPADAGYRAIYGNQVFYAEFDAGIRLYGGVYVLGGYGRLSKTGTTPELELETRSMQQFISVGFGYIRQISGLLNVEVEAALVGAKYREEALEARITGQKPGFKAAVGALFMGEEGKIFAGVKFAYIGARVTDPDIKLGGAQATLCLGLRLFGPD
jgi:hypothetical protein